MIWVRGAPEDFDTWAYLGADGWSWDDVRPVYERLEAELEPAHRVRAGRDSPRAGRGRPGIRHPVERELQRPFAGRFLVHAVHDPGWRSAQHRGGYLRPVEANEGLEIVTGAAARRLLFDASRCVGVEWSTGTAHADQIVVCGGTIGSAQLLLLSGIGPADHLRSIGIDVVVDLPGVGENLHDHLLSPVIFSADREIGSPAPGLPACQTHLFGRSRPGLPVPDIQPIHFMVPMYEEWMSGPENGFTLLGGIVRPLSRGPCG